MTGTGRKPANYEQIRIYFPGRFVVGYDNTSGYMKMDFFSTDFEVLERSKKIVNCGKGLTNAEVDAIVSGRVKVDKAVIEEFMFRYKQAKSADVALEEVVTLNLLKIK